MVCVKQVVLASLGFKIVLPLRVMLCKIAKVISAQLRMFYDEGIFFVPCVSPEEDKTVKISLSGCTMRCSLEQPPNLYNAAFCCALFPTPGGFETEK